MNDRAFQPAQCVSVRQTPTRASAKAARADLRMHARRLWAPGLVIVALLWSYWPTVAGLVEFWRTNDDYSVGMLVPPVAAYLFWRERKLFRTNVLRPNVWGLGLLLASQLLRFAGIYYAFASAERLSLVLAVSALMLLIAGRDAFRRLIWVQAFLLLLLPLPQRVHDAVSLPLQSSATSMGVFGLELLGVGVTREGNVLHVNDQTTVMVAEACSGLRMLTAFAFTAALLCFFVRRPRWHCVALVASSVPIAVISNGLRVLITVLAVQAFGDGAVEQRIHDVAGLLMMPLAVILLLGEMKFITRLTGANGRSQPVAVDSRSRRSVAG